MVGTTQAYLFVTILLPFCFLVVTHYQMMMSNSNGGCICREFSLVVGIINLLHKYRTFESRLRLQFLNFHLTFFHLSSSVQPHGVTIMAVHFSHCSLSQE